MNRILLLLLVVSSLGRAEENPFLKSPAKGEVSLPLQDWQTVWKAASTPVVPKAIPEPPLTAALQSVIYTARLDGGKLSCEAVMQVRSFSEAWQTVPLAGGEWTLEPGPVLAGVALVRQDDQLCAVIHGAGDFELKLAFSLPLTAGGAKFTAVPAAAQRFTLVEAPAGRVLMFNGHPPGGKDMVCALPAQGGEVILALEEPRPPEPPAPAPQPSLWAADAQALALFRDGELQYNTRLYLRAAKGSGLEATLNLPASAQVEEVTGDDLATWRSQRSGDGSKRVISVRWKTADKLDRRLVMRYTVPQSPVAVEWKLVAPKADETGHSAFALAPLEGIEFSHPALQKTASSRVLAWIREAAAVPELLLVEGETSIPLMAKALPRVEATKATISQMQATTRLVADGSALHELRFEFKHNGPLTWPFTLPKGSTLLACKVNDADARPVQRAESVLEFALPAKGEGSTTSTITLTWHAKGAAWDKVSGQLALDLPKTDVFTQDLNWQIELPEGYDLAATEGLDRAFVANATDRTVAFKKQLFTNEAPSIELFYQRIDLAQ